MKDLVEVEFDNWLAAALQEEPVGVSKSWSFPDIPHNVPRRLDGSPFEDDDKADA